MERAVDTHWIGGWVDPKEIINEFYCVICFRMDIV
jgi:hypothetical protein